MSSEIYHRRAAHRHPHPSSISSRRRNRPIKHRKLPNLSKPIDDIPDTDGDNRRSLASDVRLHRSITCSADLSSKFPPLLSPRSIQSFPEDSRVLVSVTVEGSPGPIRTLVKLTSTVEEAIKLVIDEYCKEGRIPPLESTSSLYQLHLSSFNFESLDRSETIGSIGSRRFYLRKRRKAVISEISCANDEVTSISSQSCPVMVLLPAYISRGIAVILRRMRNLWKMIGCLQ
ncbi:hypothetical protein V2J09_020274 [Rumex salicifolius]